MCSSGKDLGRAISGGCTIVFNDYNRKGRCLFIKSHAPGFSFADLGNANYLLSESCFLDPVVGELELERDTSLLSRSRS